MKNAPSGAIGEALPFVDFAAPPPVDPGHVLIRAVPPNVAALVHKAIMDMLRAPAAPRSPR